MKYYHLKMIEDVMLPVYWIIVLSQAWIRIIKYKKWLKENISDSSKSMYSFVKYCIVLLTLSNFLFILNIGLDFTIGFCETTYFHWQIYLIISSITIYYIGFESSKIREFKITQCVLKEKTENKSKINLSPNEIEQHKVQLFKIIESKKLYINPELDLQMLSKQLEINQHQVSFIINNELKTNFRNLINDYRIEEVKNKLVTKKFQELSILGIAFECGFNSEASFYRIFKNKTGMSPLEFVKNNSQNIK